MCPPDDSGGIYTVPSGTIVNTGDTLLPSQHNPWALDNATAMSSRFSKDGRAPATGNWNMNTFRITGLGAPTGANDATSKTYVDNAVSTQGFIWGLNTGNNAVDAVNDIDIAAGAAGADTTPFATMRLASTITKRLDANWVVGTGNGGLDTGAVGDNTYHVWLIQRPDTGVVDALFSLSPTAPTMPANYTLKRRIASIIRTAGAIVAYRQYDNVFKRAQVSNYSSTSALASTLTAFSVPSGIVVQPIIMLFLNTPAASNVTVAVGDALAGSAELAMIQNTAAGVQKAYITGGVYTDTSRQIYLSVTIASGSIISCSASTFGWIDTRGQ